MLIIGLAVHFWTAPKEELSENEKATARIARMEASVNTKSSSSKQSTAKDDSKFLNNLKTKQAKQLEYLTIVAIVFGVGFFGYSFIAKKEDA